ncbi:MAG: carbohydrate ABC transporter permease [Aggregatilineales bacterium]
MSAKVPIFNMSVGAFLVRVALITLALIWTLPTFGLLVSSFRNKDDIIASGWWNALQTSETNAQARTGSAENMIEEDGFFVITGSIFDEETSKVLQTFGGGFLPDNEALADRDTTGVADYAPGEAIELEDGSTFTVDADGTYRWTSETAFELERGQRIFFVQESPPSFSLENYDTVFSNDNIGQAFINTMTVTIPATIIPIVIAAFAAYAFSWMEFRGRQILFAVVVGLLVVPLQLSLIPLLRLYSTVGLNGTYPGMWLAHTGFGLPLAIYLLRNYIGGLPREIIESAKIDGASHFTIFTSLILPLSIPALASFAIFQFLWVWNDFLVASVFLGTQPDNVVMTVSIKEMLGTRGDQWEVLTSAAFISMAVPLVVFISMQRYFVRGLLAGSVKGG